MPPRRVLERALQVKMLSEPGANRSPASSIKGMHRMLMYGDAICLSCILLRFLFKLVSLRFLQCSGFYFC